MRLHGNLIEWKDSRGFGFIEVSATGARVFVHVSSFRASNSRPVVGEPVSFEIETDSRGRDRAVRVVRPRDVNPQIRTDLRFQETAYGAGRSQGMGIGSILGVLCLLGAAGYFLTDGQLLSHAASLFKQPASATRTIAVPKPALAHEVPMAVVPSVTFSCDGRTHCSQMRSCEEAIFFLRSCPSTEMDGDGDGVPCESQWCGR